MPKRKHCVKIKVDRVRSPKRLLARPPSTRTAGVSLNSSASLKNCTRATRSLALADRTIPCIGPAGCSGATVRVRDTCRGAE